MSRQSPTDSATDYDMYTMSKGNDGNIWCNMPVAGSLRWIKICTLGSDHTDLNLKLFDQIITRNKIFKYIGEMPISKCLGVGDSMTYPLTEFDAKKYHIYEYNECLIASEKKISQNTICDEKYEFYRDVAVDGGSFVYYDMGSVERFGQYIINTLKNLIQETKSNARLKKTLSQVTKRLKKKEKLTGYMGSLVPRFQTPFDKKNIYSHNGIGIYKSEDMLYTDDYTLKHILPESVLKSKDNVNEYKQFVFGQNNIAIIEAGTHYGDGIFPIVTNHKKTTVIQMGYTYTVIFNAICEAMREGMSNILVQWRENV